MFLTKDGQIYIPRTAEQIASDIIDRLNKRLADSQIRTGGGDIVQIDKKASNVTWLLALAVGGALADYGFNLQACAESLDFTLCSDDQIRNLLPLAGLELSEGKNAKAMVNVFNANETGGASITINAGTPFELSGMEFTAVDTITVDPQQTEELELDALERGAIDYTIGDDVTFKNAQDKEEGTELYLDTFTQGIEPFDVDDARNKLLSYRQVSTSFVGVMEQIKELSWVRAAYALFNFSFTASLTVGAVTISPRKVGLFIYGDTVSDGSDLAKLWYDQQVMETEDKPNASLEQGEGVWDNGIQTFPIKWYKCVEIPVFVKVRYTKSATQDKDSVELYIKQMILDYSSSLQLGLALTSSFMDRAFTDSTITVIDTLISLTNANYTDHIALEPYQMPIIREENIALESVDL